jgi:hypothetical protein
MRMRSRWRLSVVLILASTSVGTWLLVNRESGATAGIAAATAPVTGPIKPAIIADRSPSTAPTTATALAPKPSAPSGDTTAVKRGTLDLAFDFDGVFVPVDPFEVRLKVRAYQGDFVIVKAAEPGSRVAKGDVLLELDPQKIDEQIAAAGNEVTAAQANLAKADSDVKLGDASDALAMNSAKDELGFAQTDLKRWDATDGPADVLAGGIYVKQVDAQLDDAVDELNELKKMYKSEDLTNQTADIVMKRATRGVELDRISAEIAKATSNKATTYTPVVTRQHLVDAVDERTQAIAQLEAGQAQEKVLRGTALVSMKQVADDAARKLADLKQDRANFSIASPIDGVICAGGFTHNAWQEVAHDRFALDSKVLPDQVLMTVWTPGKLGISMDWPESQVTLLTPSVQAQVTPVAMPGLSYAGTVVAGGLIGVPKPGVQSLEVLMTLPAVDERLVPGYKANVHVDAGKLENVLLVPNTAVSHGKVWVHVLGGEDQSKPVTVGASDGHQTEIKTGLAEGDLVLTQAKH